MKMVSLSKINSKSNFIVINKMQEWENIEFITYHDWGCSKEISQLSALLIALAWVSEGGGASSVAE